MESNQIPRNQTRLNFLYEKHRVSCTYYRTANESSLMHFI